MTMDFGIFDHLDYGGAATPTDFYENRLRLAALYDKIGIHAYHLAEHHATPLGMSPSPNVFLSALAQRTSRLRFGPVVYCLPLYHPVRLLEEICMLDHMSNGRLEMGVGRGISPIELGFYGLDYDAAPGLYREAFELIIQGLQSDTLTYQGEHYQVDNMPVTLGSLQKPHPPLWYGVQNPASIDWPARGIPPPASLHRAEERGRAAVGPAEQWLQVGACWVSGTRSEDRLQFSDDLERLQ